MSSPFWVPGSPFSRWHDVPDLEPVEEKLGVEFIPVELNELTAGLEATASKKAEAIAERWMEEAEEIAAEAEAQEEEERDLQW